jgi:stage II sporulation protein D
MFLLVASSGWAAAPIRVLIFQDAARIELSGNSAIGVELPNGEKLSMTPPLSITRGGSGLRINGHRLGVERAIFRGRKANLHVRDLSNTVVVSGDVRVLDDGKALQVVNDLDLEEYVKGVVPSEMNAGWHPEALKVQAVAARTYAVHQRMMNSAREYDLVASTQDQVYRGRQGVDRRIQQAVETTRGLILTHQDTPIFAAFSSTAAGPTEDASNVWAKELPYLKGVECPFDGNSPYYQWQTKLQFMDLEAMFKRQGILIGNISAVSIFSRSRAGRVTRLRVTHSDGDLVVRGEEFRRLVGYLTIPSTQFELGTKVDEIVLTGRGAGHAVGLCQWGAKELAERGYSYDSILHYYFPSTDLKDVRLIELTSIGLP